MKSSPNKIDKRTAGKGQAQDNVAFQKHDHRRCQSHILSKAKEHCRLNKLRLTPRRQQVLEILLRSHQPMGAYDILAELHEPDSKEKLAPPMVYRALEFLQSQKLIHRLESRNAYIGCQHPGHLKASQFLICRDCDRVAELAVADSSLFNQANQIGFEVDHSVVEITGLCSRCQHAVKQHGTNNQAGLKDDG